MVLRQRAAPGALGVTHAARKGRREAAMAECLSETTNAAGPVDAKEELLDECQSIQKEMEEYQSKLMLLGTETLLPSDAKLSLLMLQWKALSAEHRQWQMKNPEIISTNPDVLLELGKEELQKVKNDLEMVLSAVRSKNKKLEKDLEREKQWYEEQEQMIAALTKTEEEAKTQVGQPSAESLEVKEYSELKNKILELKTFKNELLSTLGELLDEHFPPPEECKNTKKKRSSTKPAVNLIALKDILERLINKLITTPHDPYISIDESFWPPYIELLLRYGIALRHPQDPERMRLQAFHK
ncbi:centromere protein K [Oenanthe melanoleuca]|uniref:centromere protein K n=1 Tax=Oenanthe melanoleuca TaxID=2939378 RepID=UPI0024C0F8D3|nr:centromere protein K [Oenanthe melanoleuca]